MPKMPKINQPEYGDLKSIKEAKKNITPTPDLTKQGAVGQYVIPAEKDALVREAIKAQADAEECIRVSAANPDDPDLRMLAQLALQRYYQLREAARSGTPWFTR